MSTEKHSHVSEAIQHLYVFYKSHPGMYACKHTHTRARKHWPEISDARTPHPSALSARPSAPTGSPDGYLVSAAPFAHIHLPPPTTTRYL